MQGIGAVLKRVRLEKGITLEEIADRTKIRVKFLEAIEEENFDVLPGAIYARGFVTSYIKYLGIADWPEVQEIMKNARPLDTLSKEIKESTATRKLVPEPAAPKQQTADIGAETGDATEAHKDSSMKRRSRGQEEDTLSRKQAMQEKKKEQKRERRYSLEEKPLNKKKASIVLLSIVAIIALLAIQWFYTKSTTPEEPDNIPPAVLPEDQTEDPNIDVPEDTQPEINTPVYNGLEMQLTVIDLTPGSTDQCWSEVTVDGQKVLSETLSEGTSRQFQANSTIKVHLGNASAVQITVNGQDFGALGNKGQVVTREFTLEELTTAQVQS